MKRHSSSEELPNYWPLQSAKARFSISAEEFRRLNGDQTGQALIDALQASPHPEVDLEPTRAPMRIRDVRL